MSHAFFVPRGRHAFVADPAPRRGAVRSRFAGRCRRTSTSSRRAPIGRPRAGDLLVIGSVGAYNLIAANAWSGGVPTVVERDGAV